MSLTETLWRQLENPTLSLDERVQLQCRLAVEFEHRGQYEAARDALAEFWQGVGQRPALAGLTERTAAEVLCVPVLCQAGLPAPYRIKPGRTLPKI